MEITVQRARPADIKGVMRLLTQIAALHHEGRPDIFKSGMASKYSAEELEEIFRDEERPVFVALGAEGEVLGYCFCMLVRVRDHAVFNDCDTLYIDDFCVDESLRGQGVGKKIFAPVLEYAKQIGVYNIDLNVWEFNESAIKFYESSGFTTGRRRMELIL